MTGAVKRIRRLTLDGWFERLTFENQRLKRKIERQQETIFSLRRSLKLEREQFEGDRKFLLQVPLQTQQKIERITDESRKNHDRCTYLSQKIVELKREIGALKATNAAKET